MWTVSLGAGQLQDAVCTHPASQGQHVNQSAQSGKTQMLQMLQISKIEIDAITFRDGYCWVWKLDGKSFASTSGLSRSSQCHLAVIC